MDKSRDESTGSVAKINSFLVSSSGSTISVGKLRGELLLNCFLDWSHLKLMDAGDVQEQTPVVDFVSQRQEIDSV